MKRLFTFFIILTLAIPFYSCDDNDKLNEIELELYKKVIGEWKIVSTHTVGYWGNELLNDDYFHISDSVNHESFEKAMHFKDDGTVFTEFSHEGNIFMAKSIVTWRIEENEVKFKFGAMPYETETTIYKITNSEFHFRVFIEWQSDSLMSDMQEFELKR
jgi:hypothetical protein